MRREAGEAWRQSEDGGDYYVSITDMIIGLLFLFIILLMYFAFQLKDMSREQVIAESLRNELIQRVATELDANGVASEVDLTRGILRLPNEVLFRQGGSALSPQGLRAVRVLSDVLDAQLSCFADRPGEPRPEDCPDAVAQLDAILIEGHTDTDPVGRSSGFSDNWELSSARAASTLRAMIDHRPGLMSYAVDLPGEAPAQSLFSVAGYADQRPVAAGDDPVAKRANRRIDLRFVMAPPKPPELRMLSEGEDRTGIDARPIRPGRTVRFRTGDNSDGYLASGWSLLERWGVWSIGPEATLVLPIDPTKRAAAEVLQLDIVAVVPKESPERRVKVFVNDAPAADWVFVGPKNAYRMTLDLPDGGDAPEAPVRVRFVIENPVSPLQLGLSEDARLLGIGIQSLVLRKRQ
jgi:chemotaxis protein MotB